MTTTAYKPISLNGAPIVTTQNVTFLASLLCQAVALVLTSVAITDGNNSSTIELILVLELVVSAVEATWYTVVGALYITMPQRGIPVLARYIDWFFTTPTMLLSVLFFTIWTADRACVRPADLVGTPIRAAAVAIVVVMDWFMLACGLHDELQLNWLSNTQWTGRSIGFVPFVSAFVPLFVIAEQERTVEGIVVTLLTFFTWALYGVVAIRGGVKEEHGEWRNSCYNLLDVRLEHLHSHFSLPTSHFPLPTVPSSRLSRWPTQYPSSVDRQQKRAGHRHRHRRAAHAARQGR